MKSPPGCDLFVMASVEQDLTAALRSLAEASGAADAAAPRQPRTEAAAPSGDLTAEAIGQSLCMLMPDNAILVDEGLTSSRQTLALRPHRDRFCYHALASGGIGWGLPASVGVSLANPDRPVVCFSGDGSAMYSIQALWTAAHHKLPLTVVIANNGGYRIIKQRLLAFHGDDHYVGMDFADPPVDFAGIARSLGLEAMRITEPGDLTAKLSSAFSRPGAKLIEVMVDGAV